MGGESFVRLLGRYLSFVWMFEPVPVRAPLLVRAAVVRRNRDRGLRFLPVYMRRYTGLLLFTSLLGVTFETVSAPWACGAMFTISTLAAVALLLALVGFLGMRWRICDHARF